ncbi:MAG: 2-C-methyl-D-erythritol 4-phosphate cytidylyltransferase [Verrucomicrobia bacterium]|nr:2-C-methyl-D-erythritol 4-phosphate cytidylyltransferase [Verrucomicrobiota bacterium]
MTSAIIVAAGTSRRMGFDKLLSLLGDKPVVVHSIERFQQCEMIDEIILVVHTDRRPEFQRFVDAFGLTKVKRLVDGGPERHLSVWNGISHLSEACEIVAVHDAARPLVSPDLIGRAVALAKVCGAVSLAAPIVETLKRADPQQNVSGSVDRTGLWGMQTPQVFRFDWLIDAYKRIVDSGRTVTDEVSALQEAGYPVRLLQNPDWNIKITFPTDLDLAEKMINLREVNL